MEDDGSTQVRRTARARKINPRLFVGGDIDENFKKLFGRITAADYSGKNCDKDQREGADDGASNFLIPEGRALSDCGKIISGQNIITLNSNPTALGEGSGGFITLKKVSLKKIKKKKKAEEGGDNANDPSLASSQPPGSVILRYRSSTESEASEDLGETDKRRTDYVDEHGVVKRLKLNYGNIASNNVASSVSEYSPLTSIPEYRIACHPNSDSGSTVSENALSSPVNTTSSSKTPFQSVLNPFVSISNKLDPKQPKIVLSSESQLNLPGKRLKIVSLKPITLKENLTPEGRATKLDNSGGQNILLRQDGSLELKIVKKEVCPPINSNQLPIVTVDQANTKPDAKVIQRKSLSNDNQSVATGKWFSSDGEDDIPLKKLIKKQELPKKKKKISQKDSNKLQKKRVKNLLMENRKQSVLKSKKIDKDNLPSVKRKANDQDDLPLKMLVKKKKAAAAKAKNLKGTDLAKGQILKKPKIKVPGGISQVNKMKAGSTGIKKKKIKLPDGGTNAMDDSQSLVIVKDGKIKKLKKKQSSEEQPQSLVIMKDGKLKKIKKKLKTFDPKTSPLKKKGMLSLKNNKINKSMKKKALTNKIRFKFPGKKTEPDKPLPSETTNIVISVSGVEGDYACVAIDKDDISQEDKISQEKKPDNAKIKTKRKPEETTPTSAKKYTFNSGLVLENVPNNSTVDSCPSLPADSKAIKKIKMATDGKFSGDLSSPVTPKSNNKSISMKDSKNTSAVDSPLQNEDKIKSEPSPKESKKQPKVPSLESPKVTKKEATTPKTSKTSSKQSNSKDSKEDKVKEEAKEKRVQNALPEKVSQFDKTKIKEIKEETVLDSPKTKSKTEKSETKPFSKHEKEKVKKKDKHSHSSKSSSEKEKDRKSRKDKHSKSSDRKDKSTSELLVPTMKSVKLEDKNNKKEKGETKVDSKTEKELNKSDLTIASKNTDQKVDSTPKKPDKETSIESLKKEKEVKPDVSPHSLLTSKVKKKENFEEALSSIPLPKIPKLKSSESSKNHESKEERKLNRDRSKDSKEVKKEVGDDGKHSREKDHTKHSSKSKSSSSKVDGVAVKPDSLSKEIKKEEKHKQKEERRLSSSKYDEYKKSSHSSKETVKSEDSSKDRERKRQRDDDERSHHSSHKKHKKDKHRSHSSSEEKRSRDSLKKEKKHRDDHHKYSHRSLSLDFENRSTVKNEDNKELIINRIVDGEERHDIKPVKVGTDIPVSGERRDKDRFPPPTKTEVKPELVVTEEHLRTSNSEGKVKEELPKVTHSPTLVKKDVALPSPTKLQLQGQEVTRKDNQTTEIEVKKDVDVFSILATNKPQSQEPEIAMEETREYKVKKDVELLSVLSTDTSQSQGNEAATEDRLSSQIVKDETSMNENKEEVAVIDQKKEGKTTEPLKQESAKKRSCQNVWEEFCKRQTNQDSDLGIIQELQNIELSQAKQENLKEVTGNTQIDTQQDVKRISPTIEESTKPTVDTVSELPEEGKDTVLSTSQSVKPTISLQGQVEPSIVDEPKQRESSTSTLEAVVEGDFGSVKNSQQQLGVDEEVIEEQSVESSSQDAQDDVNNKLTKIDSENLSLKSEVEGNNEMTESVLKPDAKEVSNDMDTGTVSKSEETQIVPVSETLDLKEPLQTNLHEAPVPSEEEPSGKIPDVTAKDTPTKETEKQLDDVNPPKESESESPAKEKPVQTKKTKPKAKPVSMKDYLFRSVFKIDQTSDDDEETSQEQTPTEDNSSLFSKFEPVSEVKEKRTEEVSSLLIPLSSIPLPGEDAPKEGEESNDTDFDIDKETEHEVEDMEIEYDPSDFVGPYECDTAQQDNYNDFEVPFNDKNSRSNLSERDTNASESKSKDRTVPGLDLNVTPKRSTTAEKNDKPPVKELTQEEKEKRDKQVVDDRMNSYESLEENYYLVDKVRNKRSKEAKRMVCDCSLTKEEILNNEMGCGDDCLNRLLMIECGSRCPLNELCMNKKFQQKKYAPVEVFNAEEKGCGVRARQEIQQGTFIMEYVGEVFDTKEFKRRRKEYAKGSSAHFYFMALRPDRLIDATRKGNISRFINHSCSPNAETQKWTVNGDLRIGFFATRTIVEGEEINFDYRLERYGREPQRCYCGTPECRGWLGEPPDQKTKEEKEEDRKREMKERQRRESKRLSFFEDMDLEDEIEKLTVRGLRNRQDTLNLSRLMVRCEDSASRLSLLKILESGEEASKKLFLDYHGLKLLWSWMVDISSSHKCYDLKIKILKTLQGLPITNKTQVTDSKIMDMVERWSKEQSKPTEHVKKEAPKERKLSDGSEDSDTETSEAKDSDPSSSETVSPDDSSQDSTTGSQQKTPEEEELTKEGTEPSLTVSGEEVATQSPTTPTTEEPEEVVSVPELAASLVAMWSDLKEAFKIPKKERLEMMKEHERQVEKEYKMYLDKKKLGDRTEAFYDRWRYSSGPEKEKERQRERERRDKRRSRRKDDDDLSKEERRERFAMQVAKEDEEARQRKLQEEMWKLHLERCTLLGHDPYFTPIFDPSGQYYWDPGTKAWETYVGPNGNLPVPASYGIGAGGPPTDADVLCSPSPFGQMFVPGAFYPLPHAPHLDPEGHVCSDPTDMDLPLSLDPASIPLPGEQPGPKGSTEATGASDTPVPGLTIPIAGGEEAHLPEDMVNGTDSPPLAPPGPVTIKLPARWKMARDADLRIYFYHTRTRHSTWDLPTADLHQQLLTRYGITSDSDSDLESDSESSTSSDSEDFSSDEEEVEEEEKERPLVQQGENVDEKMIRRPRGRRGHSEKLVQERVISPILFEDREAARRERKEAKERAREEARKERWQLLRVLRSGSVSSTSDVIATTTSTSKSEGDGLSSSVASLEDPDYPSPPDDEEDTSEDAIGVKLSRKLKSEGKGAHKAKSKERAATAMADTSERARKIKDNFRSRMATYIVSVLNPYRKPDCKEGRITCNDDFKYLARKLTHFVMVKELKQLPSVDGLDCSESVKHKTKEFVRKYMSKYGDTFKRDPNDTKEY